MARPAALHTPDRTGGWSQLEDTESPDGRVRSPWAHETATILRHARGGPDWYTLTLSAGALATAALPGQFVQVDVRGDGAVARTADPLLRRPLSLCTIDAAGGRISLIYRVVGRGTALLARARPGDRLSLLGPLGRSFPEPSRRPDQPLLLVGGGLGIPPLAGAAAWARRAGRQPVALLGARRAADLAGVTEVRAAGGAVVTATEDGSAGRRGLVTDILSARLSADMEVWACGPNPMLAAVADLCRRAGAECWLCVERPMACGFGVCIGCAISRAAGGGYLKACVDGPVFAAAEVNVLA